MASETGRVFLQWNVTNWVTVVLMASLGVAFAGIVLSYVRSYTERMD